VYGPVRTVVWEDGGRAAPSYPIVALAVVSPRGQALTPGVHQSFTGALPFHYPEPIQAVIYCARSPGVATGVTAGRWARRDTSPRMEVRDAQSVLPELRR
jgi:hypothetical protein